MIFVQKWINRRKHVEKDEEKNEQEEKEEAEWDEEEKEEDKDTLKGANIVPMREISAPFANAANVREANLAASSIETIFEQPINRNRETLYFDAKSNV